MNYPSHSDSFKGEKVKLAALFISTVVGSYTWACSDLAGTYVADGVIKTKVEIKVFQKQSQPRIYVIETTSSTDHKYDPNYIIDITRLQFTEDASDIYEKIDFENKGSYKSEVTSSCALSKLKRSEDIYTNMGKNVEYNSTTYSLDSSKNLVIELNRTCVPNSKCTKKEEARTYIRQVI